MSKDRVMTTFQNYLLFIARLLFSLCFILSGLNKLMNFQSIVSAMIMVGQSVSTFWLVVMCLLQLAGGVMIFLGFLTRLGAVFALFSILLVQLIFHSYFSFSADFPVLPLEVVWINLMVMSGAILWIVCGPGSISVDGFRYMP